MLNILEIISSSHFIVVHDDRRVRYIFSDAFNVFGRKLDYFADFDLSNSSRTSWLVKSSNC